MNTFKLKACMPFVHLGREDVLDMGPVKFWRASVYKSFVQPNAITVFEEFIKQSGKFSIMGNFRDRKITSTIPPEMMTCILVEEKYATKDDVNELIHDASYLLFFCNHLSRNGGFLNPYLRKWTADESYLTHGRWRSFHHYEHQKEPQAEVRYLTDGLLESAGKLLKNKYLLKGKPSAFASRAIRSIQYFSRRFFDTNREELIGLVMEPEDVVFLVTAFESLFDTNSEYQKWKNETPNFSNRIVLKARLKKLLRLGDERPEAILEKWVEGIYDWRNEIAHGEHVKDRPFAGNPNHPISFLGLGMALFTFCIYLEFQKRRYFSKKQFDLHYIRSKETLLPFLWTQNEVLKEIQKWLNRFLKAKGKKGFLKSLIGLEKAATLYTDCYGSGRPSGLENLKFESGKTKKMVKQIIEMFELNKKIAGRQGKIKDYWGARSSHSGTAFSRVLNDLRNLESGH